MKNILKIFLIYLLINQVVFAKPHEFKEVEYQTVWCNSHHGIMEYENRDKTRVDCLTQTHAVEFDFAKKWAESVGQALYYQLMTGKKAMVVLILEDPVSQMVYFNKIKKLSQVYNFDVEYITSGAVRCTKHALVY